MLVYFDKEKMFDEHLAKNKSMLVENASFLAQKIVDKFEKLLMELGEFMDAAEVHYEDSHKKEKYVIVKGEKKLTLSIGGNSFDGGWMNSKIEEM